jgi:hypothetical protein
MQGMSLSLTKKSRREGARAPIQLRRYNRKRKRSSDVIW